MIKGNVYANEAWFQEAGRSLTWEETHRVSSSLRNKLLIERPSMVLAPVRTGLALATVLLATRDLGVDVLITGPCTAESDAMAVGADIVIEFDDSGFTVSGLRRLSNSGRDRVLGKEAGVWLLSSGTTGHPRASRWPWSKLTHGRIWNGGGDEHWGVGYVPHSFAGVSATCQALGRVATLEFIRPEDLSLPERSVTTLNVAAATPSFWRMAAIATSREAEFRRIDNVTVGGEPVDQSLLDLLREVVAPRRIIQIFGTTEVGAAILVDDGLPGLPAALQGRRMPNGAMFEVSGRHLMISPAPDLPLISTGDLVRLVDGRIHIEGRVGVHINVGGKKVNPYRVIELLQEHPAVIAARAYGIRSPILGQVIGADVVLRDNPDPQRLVAELKRLAGVRLEPHERPLRIQIVADLVIAPSGKVQL